ncbi:hypothetical protein E0H39_29795 [Rhizobium leguminosarum bv. viciae]|uniref:hypothetical protein n=1 Tax=Rhizobium leguminosarum TaxID=384 RepID=UPI0010400D6A|nr:hypothetical protein [Rhizobium leguminosarum]NKL63325.1 hypothetical protein [Rhizobium leguminosarum bv. viciae]TBY57701.1 hypothetical protein E0H39_29795 [Rhizobium leguminosarum bv. viciae]
MPRKPGTEPQRQRHQQRQRVYRERLRAEGRPEADAVDAALAAALCGTAADERDAATKDLILKGYLAALLKRARRELLKRGYDRSGATAALQRRLHRITP